jgi:hypothetical protein
MVMITRLKYRENKVLDYLIAWGRSKKKHLPPTTFRPHCEDCEPKARQDAAIVLGGAASIRSTIAALRSQ